MNKWLGTTVIVFAFYANSAQTSAQNWVEQGDAGSLPETAQPIFGGGPLGAIDGNTGVGDFEDMYLIEITDPDNFSASTSPGFAGGGATFDTQLFVFDMMGFGIAANDDCPFDPGMGNGSCIAGIGPAGLGLITQPGQYFIAVTGVNDDPVSPTGDIFNQNPINEITGPDGLGGMDPIIGWNGLGQNGMYTIQLTGADFIIPPSPFEPGVKHTPPAAPCECEECPEDASGYELDPVYLFSGEFYHDQEDLKIPGRGFDFVWARKYRSRFGPTTAQGNGWDYSYNIRIEPFGPHLNLFDGHSRADIYQLQPDGSWTRDEFFRVITVDINGIYTLTFPDTGTWNFNPLNGAPEEGKISSIIDRNGNTMSFDYDATGRLATIHDTLDSVANPRTISISYTVDGFIGSITDFAGRTVTYDYYQNGDPGGSFGDLKSVTSPVVVNTPNFPIPPGHDYPTGKTTIYTYSTGFADDNLNHNLLTITDPKGQLWLSNVYAPTLDPMDFNFDRIIRQLWGNQNSATGDIVDIVYIPLVPDPANNFAVVKAIVNDRVGDVKEFFYDGGNRGVMEHIFTGRADPDLPTTDINNRPTAPLRTGDPVFFETRYEYNNDSLHSTITHPNGNQEVFVYDEPNPIRRSQGNLLEHQRLPGPLAGDQTQISELFTYDDGFGGCCGTNFVTSHIDGRGNTTTHVYDAVGNRTHTTHRIPSIVEDFEYNAFGQLTAHVLPDNGSAHRRRDEYSYYAVGPQTGYRQNQIIDATGFALTTTYEYDRVGNVTRATDPRGHDTQQVYNQLNQVVREISREVTTGGGLRYEKDTFYDANDNVIRVDIQNVDDLGVLQTNTHFSTIYEYEILNFLTRRCEEVGSVGLTLMDRDCASLPQSDSIVTEYQYDANRNRTLVRYGEATDGDQLTNEVQTLYDERDLVFQEIRAPGDPDVSTTQYDYDGNRNTITISHGLEDTPRVNTFTYDGYDRIVDNTDPMDNITTYHYDANNNRVSFRLDGELDDIPGSVGNVRLYESTFAYDAVDRLTTTTIEFFDANTQAPLPGGLMPGKSISTLEYSDNSQVTRTVDDNSHQTLRTYDTANRMSVVTDHKNNTSTYVYDANSNVISVTEVEKSDLLNPDETFVTTNVYDNLDRLISRTDNVGNTHSYGYDSRNNQTVTTDALNHEIRYTYDGINRPVSTVRDLDGDGADGDGADITTLRIWDDSTRLIGQTDDNSNTTSYAYDALDRLTAETQADGTIHIYTYDVHNNQTGMTDANGSVTTCTYDLNDRATNKAVVPGPGVSSDTTFELYNYDGLSRIVHAEDDDSLVLRSYDSLSRVTSETLNGQTTTFVYDGVGNQLQCTYPGGRIITCTYDELDRKKTVSEGLGSIATYDYIGPGRVERREFGNGTRTDYVYDGILPNPPGDSGLKRIIGTTHSVIAGGAILDDRTYLWDAMQNKTQRADTRAGGPQQTHDYVYDDVYRLIHTTAGNGMPLPVRDTIYTLDGVGNRTQVAGTPNPGAYAMDATMPTPADQQLNQYTRTPFDYRQYDANGNLIASFPCLEGDVNGDLILDFFDVNPFVSQLLAAGPVTCESDLNSDGSLDGLDVNEFIDRLLGTSPAIPDFAILYDYRNRMVEYFIPETGERHTYCYDALGRRTRRIVDADAVAGGPDETRYFYDGWRVSEEQDSLGATQATYVYGLYIDEVLQMQRGGVDFYYHADDLFNVMAVTDGAGAVVERYEYDDYGRPLDVSTLDPVVGNPSSIGNPYLFQGRRHDPETGWYYFRTRYLDPIGGRFTTRDTIGIWGDDHNIGNGYAYVGNEPTNHLDPLGEGVDVADLAYRIMIKLKKRGGGAQGLCGRLANAKLLDFTQSIGVSVATAPLRVIAGQGFFGNTAKAIADGIDKIEDAKDKIDKLKDAVSNALNSGGYKAYKAKLVIGDGPCSCYMRLVFNTKTGAYQAFFTATTGTNGNVCCPPYTITRFRVTGTAKMVDKDRYWSKQLEFDSHVHTDSVQRVGR